MANRGARKTDWNNAIQVAIDICEEEALACTKNAEACDDTDDYLGGYAGTQAALTAKYLRERIAQLFE